MKTVVQEGDGPATSVHFHYPDGSVAIVTVIPGPNNSDSSLANVSLAGMLEAVAEFEDEDDE